MKELREMLARGLVWMWTAEKILEELKKGEERFEQVAREFYRQQSSLFESYSDKKLEISANFFDVAMKELRDSFIFGGESGMLAFFKPLDGVLYCNEFYGSGWIYRHDYGRRSSATMWFQERDFGDWFANKYSFGFDTVRLARIMRRRNKDDLLVLCHTHPGVAYPSEGDQRPYSLNIIIGFDKVSEGLQQLIHKTFDRPPMSEIVTEIPVYRGQIPAREWKRYVEAFENGNLTRKLLHDIPFEAYNELVAECNPTIRFFYTDGKSNVNRIPLHVNGRELL